MIALGHDERHAAILSGAQSSEKEVRAFSAFTRTPAVVFPEEGSADLSAHAAHPDVSTLPSPLHPAPTQERNTMTTIHYDPSKGADIPQGDLLLTNLRHPVFGKRWQDRALDGADIRRAEGSIRLLEGEVTGHHHEILFGSKHLARFRDDGMAADLAATAPVAIGTARLVSDDGALADLIRSDHWHERYRSLHIGLLVVEGGPVDLIHPEHDAWRLPAGVYAVGRQIESAGAEERLVAD